MEPKKKNDKARNGGIYNTFQFICHMARRKKSEKRIPLPDIRYNSTQVAKFINYVMRKGKKTVARRIVYGAFDIVKEKTGKEPLAVFEVAVRNASPVLETRSRRVGGASYQVPIEVRPDRRVSLAMRWIISAAKGKKGGSMAEKLAEELIAASQNTGAAVKKKGDTHRMAEANRAFAHYAW